MQPVVQTMLEEGWPSIKSYLNKMNMSRATIDHRSQLLHPKLANDSDDTMYRIKGGNDLLAKSMVADCETI